MAYLSAGSGLRYALQDTVSIFGAAVSLRSSSPCCAVCGKTHINAGAAKVMCCSVCQNIYYCAADCQRSDWKRHKKECQAMKRLYDEKQGRGTDIVDAVTEFTIEYTLASMKPQASTVATGYGNSSVILSPVPTATPHLVVGGRGGPDGPFARAGQDIPFKNISDLHIGMQFILQCGFFGNLEKAQEILPAVLSSLRGPTLLSDLRLHSSYLNALEIAARKGKYAVCEWLVTDKRTRHHFLHDRHLLPDGLGEATVGWALYANNVDLARMLVSHGVEPFRTNGMMFGDQHPMHLAAQSGSFLAVKYCVEELGMDINYIHPGAANPQHGHIIWACNDSTRARGSLSISAPSKLVLDWTISMGARWPV